MLLVDALPGPNSLLYATLPVVHNLVNLKNNGAHTDAISQVNKLIKDVHLRGLSFPSPVAVVSVESDGAYIFAISQVNKIVDDSPLRGRLLHMWGYIHISLQQA